MKLIPKKKKCTWPHKHFAFGSQRNLYSTFHFKTRVGNNANFKTRLWGIANFSIFRYQHVGIANVKFRECFCVAVEYRLKAFRFVLLFVH